MSFTDVSSTVQSQPARNVWRLMLALLAVLLTVGIGLAALERGKLELLVVLLAAPAVGWACLKRPQIAIYLALFLLYTNLPVIAKRFHGLPHPVVFSVPLLLALPIAWRVLFNGQPIILPRLTVWIALLLMVQAASVLFSDYPQLAFEGLIISLTEGALLFLLVVNAVRTQQELRGAVWALLAAGALLGAASAHQYLTKSYHRQYGGLAQVQGKGFGVQGERTRVIQHRAAGPLGVENRYAQIMLMLVPLGLFLFWGEPQPRRKWLALAATGLIMSGWALTFSRGSAVGLALTSLVMAGLGYVRLRQLLVIGALAGLLLLALPQYRTRLATLTALPALFSRTAGSASRPDGAVTGRATEMLAAARVYADHPIIGVGPTVFRYYAQDYGRLGGLKALEAEREAHCLYLAVAAELGTLGMIFLFGGIAVTLRDLARVRRRLAELDPRLARLAAGFFFMIVVYLATGIFAHFSFIRYFWTMMALATACVCIAEKDLADQSASQGAATCNPNTC